MRFAWTVFWVLTPCKSKTGRRFGGTYDLHPQGRRNQQKQVTSSSATPDFLLGLFLDPEDGCSSETSGSFRTTWHYNLDDPTLMSEWWSAATFSPSKTRKPQIGISTLSTIRSACESPISTQSFSITRVNINGVHTREASFLKVNYTTTPRLKAQAWGSQNRHLKNIQVTLRQRKQITDKHQDNKNFKPLNPSSFSILNLQ
jgi:hypothetical protein